MSITTMSTSEDPRELRDFTKSVAIVVSSCDAFFDAWGPFAFFFKKYWPDCPLPLYLITNELEITSATIQPLAVGVDRGWATNLQAALDRIPHDHILYMQEDYFLTAPAHTAQVAQDFEEAFGNGADSLCFRARTHRESAFQPLNERFGVVPSNSDGRTRCQVTLWNRRKLLSILRPAENAWDMEREGSARTRDLRILSYGRRENSPIPYLVSAIVRGLWTTKALALCRHHGVTISPRFRSEYSGNSLVRGIRRRLTRRRAAHALEAQQQRILDLD